ncbi:MAG: flagellar basal body P-ring formation protein FlgA [Sulfuricellaceae bacterium]|nr:flagellar basal body P-ring formation protein FlgA [Sulfuricellaceae bacterium]
MYRPLFLLFLLLPLSAQAATWQNIDSLRALVENFVKQQSNDSGRVSEVSVGHIDPRLRLSHCPSPEAFLPPGSRLWGNTTVGIRCQQPAAWTIYVPVSVQVNGNVVVTAYALPRNHIIALSDLRQQSQDIAQLPPGTISDPRDAVGKTLSSGIPAGYPLRADMLRAPQSIRQGQTVTLQAKGNGFSVSSEGQALGSASEGESVQVRTRSGQVVTGTARAGGVVEIAF